SLYVYGDTLYVTLVVKNKTGHKLPSGYPSRLAWMELTLQDRNTKEVIYKNGALDEAGNITGRDHPFETHHQVSRSENDVQIYEMVMSDLSGQLTTRLNAAYQPLKDNRLLPTGFSRNHSAYDTVAVWGTAQDDPDFGINSFKGVDSIEYRIPLYGHKGQADLSIAMHYQTLPSRWMADLFENDTIDLVAHFKTMYEGYNRHFETIDEIEIDSIDLSTSSTSLIGSLTAIVISPNPVYGAMLHISFTEQIDLSRQWTYSIIDINGRKIQSGPLSEDISLLPTIRQGVYYFALFTENKIAGIKPFTVL
ncbi:MAG TPA: T9SS type A sorting domain-containing protein, partial [Saprospiraceae bacterium]